MSTLWTVASAGGGGLRFCGVERGVGLCGVVVGLFDVLRWYWVCVVIEGGGVLYVVGGCCVA